MTNLWTAAMMWWPLLIADCCHGFCPPMSSSRPPLITRLAAALGEYSLSLSKPLGIILEERGEGNTGVQIESMSADGAAARSGKITRGDVLMQVNDEDVSGDDFDSVMDMLIKAPDQVKLTWSDGLGAMDMAKNCIKQFKSPDEA